MGVVVAREHPGSSSPAKTTSTLRIGHVHGRTTTPSDSLATRPTTDPPHTVCLGSTGSLVLLSSSAPTSSSSTPDGDVRGDVEA